ncbi:zinc-dependent metalloprotease [Aliikangiella sp. G2MR2-5]|uniref:zinc-dependent metalloprotease n=1 Tax=Aliikangiella sp. G2MR2-5 TaxID=2788943 RepID=UPI0018AC6954|nr:zinc-dependent metalloprotease [Aliikangiella sp. G2MR2-5]
MKNALAFLSFSLLAQLVFAVTQPAWAGKLTELERSYELDNGFVSIIRDVKQDKIYLKIDNLGQEFIYQTSLPSGLGSNDIGLDRGQLSDTRLAVFEQLGNKVLLKQIPVRHRAVSDNIKEREAVEEAFASSVLYGFEVVDSGKGWVLVDASDFALQDIHGVARRLADRKQGSGFKVDKSRSAVYMPRTTAFTDNTEIESVITLVGNGTGEYLKQVAPEEDSISLKMHHSFVRLPDDKYQPRTFYPKSGYWSIQYKDYASPINEPLTKRFIGRHRLEKKNPDAEVSEPVKPIIYYLDPGVPEPVRSALIDGAMWWNTAFEAIGYKNAFQVKMLPDNADPMDVRYNVIQWVHRATRGWSYGSTITDPRTGEIIKGLVTLGSLRVRQDYLIAQGMMSPFAQDEKDEKLTQLALARIRQLSAHEVGHTLGLAHNFAASTYGRASVMDYPHPLFQLQGNQIVAGQAYTNSLGAWDMAVIAYGYQDFAKGKEEAWLKQLIAQNDQKGMLYITDQDARSVGSPNARASLWDNGSDPVAELKRMFELRQVALGNLGSKSIKRGTPWSQLEEVLVPVYLFHRYQTTAAVKLIGGLDYDYSIKRNNQLPKVNVVSGEKQTAALNAILATLKSDFLKLPANIAQSIPPNAYGFRSTRESVVGASGAAFDQIALAQASAQISLNGLFNSERLSRLIEQSATDPTIPSIDSIATEVHQQIIEQNFDGIDAVLHQAVVDLVYTHYLNLYINENTSQQVKMQILGVILKEKDYLQRKLTAVRKTTSYYGFYAYQASRMDAILSHPEPKVIPVPTVPPGSPI